MLRLLLVLLLRLLLILLLLRLLVLLLLFVTRTHRDPSFLKYSMGGCAVKYAKEERNDKMKLPEAFLRRMARFPNMDLQELIACIAQPRRGLRVNPLKCNAESLRAALPFELESAPFSPLSYYLPNNAEGVGRLALHHAGAFYVQEPSAASAVTVLDPQPGERVLDLCAAPGGKSTQIAGALAGQGLLWANELVPNRAEILLSNIERLGVRNAVVSSCTPDVLCAALAGFFDRVLVDAPCSGEGMFGRDEQAIAEWSEAHVAACAVRQQKILDSAAQAVRTGGVLVYSTCTFSPEENEQTAAAFLRAHPEFELEDAGVSFGRPGIAEFAPDAPVTRTRRILPMDGGAGHFVARFRRTGENMSHPAMYVCPKPDKDAQNLFEALFSCECWGTPARFGDRIVLLPAGLPRMERLGVLRAGVALAEVRKNRLEPMHGVFAAARPGEARQQCTLPAAGAETDAFLRGEEIPCDARGYTAVDVAGVALGFGKASGGTLKNRYPKGLRQR